MNKCTCIDICGLKVCPWCKENVPDSKVSAASVHTPGPWFVTYGGSGAMYIASKAASIGYQTIVEMHSKPACVELDARLIAAAPELLAAVKSMLLYIETYGGEVTANFSGDGNLEFYKALLAKAEGEEK